MGTMMKGSRRLLMTQIEEHDPVVEMSALDIEAEASNARWRFIMERLSRLKTTINCGRSIVGEKRQQAMGETKCVGH